MLEESLSRGILKSQSPPQINQYHEFSPILFSFLSAWFPLDAQKINIQASNRATLQRQKRGYITDTRWTRARRNAFAFSTRVYAWLTSMHRRRFACQHTLHRRPPRLNRVNNALIILSIPGISATTRPAYRGRKVLATTRRCASGGQRNPAPPLFTTIPCSGKAGRFWAKGGVFAKQRREKGASRNEFMTEAYNRRLMVSSFRNCPAM